MKVETTAVQRVFWRVSTMVVSRDAHSADQRALKTASKTVV